MQTLKPQAKHKQKIAQSLIDSYTLHYDVNSLYLGNSNTFWKYILVVLKRDCFEPWYTSKPSAYAQSPLLIVVQVMHTFLRTEYTCAWHHWFCSLHRDDDFSERAGSDFLHRSSLSQTQNANVLRQLRLFKLIKPRNYKPFLLYNNSCCSWRGEMLVLIEKQEKVACKPESAGERSRVK